MLQLMGAVSHIQNGTVVNPITQVMKMVFILMRAGMVTGTIMMSVLSSILYASTVFETDLTFIAYRLLFIVGHIPLENRQLCLPVHP